MCTNHRQCCSTGASLSLGACPASLDHVDSSAWDHFEKLKAPRKGARLILTLRLVKACQSFDDGKDILKGSCVLAEDRLLTYAALFPTKPEEAQGLWRLCSSGSGSTILFEPDAIFYFQSESTLSSYVKQRCRWLNGSIACDLWTNMQLGRPDLPHTHACCRIFLIRMTNFLMLSIYAGISLGPALYTIGMVTALYYLGSKTNPEAEPFERRFTYYVLGFSWFVLHLGFAVLQHTDKNKGFHGVMWVVGIWLGVFLAPIILAGLIYGLILQDGWVQVLASCMPRSPCCSTPWLEIWLASFVFSTHSHGLQIT